MDSGQNSQRPGHDRERQHPPTNPTIDDGVLPTTKIQPQQTLTISGRFRHFTWAWYTLPMSTGGLALLLAPQVQPHTFPGLDTIGKVVYIFDLVIFTLITLCMTYRFIHYPTTLKSSLTHPTESLFVGTSFLSLASIISCIARYGIPTSGPWLITTYRVLYWIYFALSLILAVGQYVLLFTNPMLKIQDMTPAWDLPIFPFMLSGTIAAAGASSQPEYQAVPMIISGLTAQGLGFLVSILMYASYVRRMIQYGFPSPNSRPAMFIAVGPPSFTALALIGMARDFPVGEYAYFGNPIVTSQVLVVMATVTAVFIWSLSLWFFFIAVLANLAVARQLTFHLNWWAYVFPNVGFTIAVVTIGKQFQSQGVQWLGSIMTILLVTLYLCVFVMHVRAVWKKEILWEGKDEDVYVKERKGKEERAALMGLDVVNEKAD